MLRQSTFDKLAVVLFAAGIAGLAAPAAAQPADVAAIQTKTVLDHDLPDILVKEGIASVSIAQIRNGRVVLTAAYGFQSPDMPATTSTLYNIASLTKPLSAEIMLRLASKDRVKLDEPMYKYWTDPDLAGDDRAKLLTLRMALSHKSGLPNWRDRKEGLKFVNDPGSQFGYSGEGYEYAARYTEKRAGGSFEDLAQSTLFRPAGMTETAYTGRPWFDGRVAEPNDATGKALEPYVRKRFSAADAVYTTPRDYATFMTNVLKDTGLTPAIARERWKVQTSFREHECQGAKKAAACPQDTGMGLGWQVLAFKGATMLMHTGKDEGVFTLAYLDRSTGEGAVILTSSDNGAKVVLPVLERLNASPEFIGYLKSQMD